MGRQKRAKWVDPRTPVSVTHIGKFVVTIYDQAAYDESLQKYGDEDDTSSATKAVNEVSQPFRKQKQQARYNWTTPLSPSSILPPRAKKRREEIG